MQKIIHNPALKETIFFSATSAETGGAYSDLEISLAPGGGNPMHLHRSYSETFTTRSGILGLELAGGRKVYLAEGESYTVHKNVPHRFFNPTKVAITFTNRVEPGSTGLEQTLQILAGLAADGRYNSSQLPSNLLDLAVCARLSDMRLTGMAGLLSSPILGLLYQIAKRKHVPHKLLNKYCIRPFQLSK